MVFESVVADILNIYLGDYVENLDRSQLQIGIWGGDVVLQDLTLKPNVFDELHLPVKCIFGHLGRLILKIPWKNLYGAPVIAKVERLFLLARPDPDSHTKSAKNAKKSELQRLEVARRLKNEADKAKTSDTFVEKLATQIIKNIQISIQDIHIRYEDDITNQRIPFSLGITLHHLSVQTTDKNWQEGVVQDKSSMIYKVLNLEGLAVYWNCHSNLISVTDDTSDILRLFQEGIFKKDKHPKGFSYMLGPINSSALLQLNPKPENDDTPFTVPKIFLTLMMEKLAVGISKEQYHSLVELLDFFDFTRKVSEYQKYRPLVPRERGYYKHWWRFAAACVLSHRWHGIDWEQVQRHRAKCRAYASAYMNKLQASGPLSPEAEREIAQCEEDLDVFNIMLIRRQVEAEIEWLNKKSPKVEKAQGISSWLGSWWGGGTSTQSTELTDKFRHELTQEERLKLYQAIDYEENAAPTLFPEEFVERQVCFRLGKLTVEFHNFKSRVLLAELSGVSSTLEQRPAANAFSMALKMTHLSAWGLGADGTTPQLIQSLTHLRDGSETALMRFWLETNPLDKSCGRKLRIHAAPLQIIYDAHTVNKLTDIFQGPSSEVLVQLQAAAGAQLSEVSALGLQYAIEHHVMTEIEMDMKSSRVLVPYGGCYSGHEDLLVINLGQLNVMTLPRDSVTNLRALYQQGVSEEAIVQTMRAETYDRFVLELKDVQVLMALSGEDWLAALNSKASGFMHLLQPTSLACNVEKCLVTNDPTLPNVKVTGQLSTVSFTVEDNRLIHLMQLYNSIPFSESQEKPKVVKYVSDTNILEKILQEPEESNTPSDLPANAVKLELGFAMQGMTATLYKSDPRSPASVPRKLLQLSASHFGFSLLQQTADVSVCARLGGITLAYCGGEGMLKLLDPAGPDVVDCPDTADMLTMKFTSVDEGWAEKTLPRGEARQILEAEFSHLTVLLHREVLLVLLTYSQELNKRLEMCSQHAGSVGSKKKSLKTSAKVPVKTKEFSLKFSAKLHALHISMIQEKQTLANFVVEGMETIALATSLSTNITARLRNVSLLDPNPVTPHHKVVSILGKEALSVEVIMHSEEKKVKKNRPRMSVKAQLAQSRIVFLNNFTQAIMDFLSSFQAAKDNLAQAVAEAAEAARQKVINAHAEAQFVSLNLSFQAPLIIVPVNALSLEALQLDFGKLVVNNKLQTVSERPADVIKLDLQHLHVMRIVLSEHGDVLSERQLVMPVSFTMQMIRSLSSSPDCRLPEIAVKGHLNNLQASLNRDDVHMFMRTLAENLGDSKKHPSQNKSKSKEVTPAAEEPGASLNWEVALTMGTLRLELGLNSHHNIQFELSGSDLAVHKSKNMKVTFRIKDLVAVSPSVLPAYQKIVQVEGKEVLCIDVIMNDRTTKRSSDDDDIAVRATMARIRFMYVASLLSAMKEFLQAFNYEPEGIVEAMAGVAGAAKEEVLDAHNQATRIGLDVDLKAPVIVVPRHESDIDALLMDFGNLTLKNKFESVEDPLTGHFALMDNMVLGLQNLKISRVQLGARGEVESECLLLEPVNLTIHVKRNMSSRRVTSLPDLSLHGHLKSVVVAVNQEDIQMVLEVLNSFSGSNSQKTESRAVTVQSNDQADMEAAQTPGMSVIFSFTMDKLLMELFDEAPNLIDFVGSVKHTPETSLSRWALVLLTIHGSMTGDGTLETTLVLSDCRLDDSRIQRQRGLTRLMESKHSAASTLAGAPAGAPETRNMEIHYVKRGLASEVKVHVYSFNLVLSLEYLKLLAAYMGKAFEQPGPEAPKAPDFRNNMSRQITTLASSSPASEELLKTFMLTVNAEKSDVFLVEDMSDPMTTALVLRSEIKCSTHQSTAAVEVKGSIRELQLFSCCYHPGYREDTMSQILQPCSVKLEGSLPQFHIQVSNVRLRVSPGTIDLLSRVMTAVYAREEIAGDQQSSELNLSEIWLPKPLNATDHWFLKTEMGEDALQMDSKVAGQSGSLSRNLREVCVLKMPSVTLTVEAGAGSHTLPMVMITMGINALARDWSERLIVESTLSLQMAYYNSHLALWEPLVEPVEVERFGQVSYKPWEIDAKVEMVKASNREEVEEVDGASQPSMKIEISSENSLEVTVTKTCLEVLSGLGSAFQLAGHEVRREGPAAPYQIINHLGVPVVLLLTLSPFKLYNQAAQGPDGCTLQPGESIALRMDTQTTLSSPLSLLTQGQAEEKFLSVQLQQLGDIVSLPMIQAGQRFFPLRGNLALISDIQVESGSTIVTLRSVLQIFNNLGMPIDVHYLSDSSSDLTHVGTIPIGKHMDVPFNAVHSASQDVYISVPGYSKVCYKWSQESSSSAEALRECKPKQKSSNECVYLRIVKKQHLAYFKETNTPGTSSFFVKLLVQPSVKIKNLLPIGIVLSQPEAGIIHALMSGENLNFATAHPNGCQLMIQIPEYRQEEWHCFYELNHCTPEFSEVEFRGSTGRVISIGVHSVSKVGVFICTLYSPYWMLNKTGLPLSYKLQDGGAEVIHSSSDYLCAVMLPSCAGSKKSFVRVADGMWSDGFSLDVAGSSGIVCCPALGQVYQLGVSVQLMRCTLTKQVTFTPRFVLMNSCRNAVECQEADRPADLWIKVEPGSCWPLWPVSPEKDVLLRARLWGSPCISGPFPCHIAHTTLLRLDNQWGGLNVDVQLTESSVYVRFTDYEPGHAAALLVNHSKHPISFLEKGSDFLYMLNPMTEMLFTWMNPCGPRELDFVGSGKPLDKEVCRLRRDATGILELKKNRVVFWSSFLDGAQRVLLFSDDPSITLNGQEAGSDRIVRRLILKLSGLGLSLVDNEERVEVVYLGITRMPRQLRERFNKSLTGSQTDEVGLWARLTWLPHEMQMHMRVDHLQVDCQLPECTYPVALAPVPPSRSVAASNVARPFTELSVVVRRAAHSNLLQVQYCRALVQAFHVRVDMGLLSALAALVEVGEPSDEVETAQFLEDKRLVSALLEAHVALGAARGQKHFFHWLHFSPLKIHLSMSLSGDSGVRKGREPPHALKVLLHSLGVTLTNVQDVVFRLAFFERQDVLLSGQELVSQACDHYRSQVLKQLYVFVLGLDVLGNPVSLVKGFKQGVEDMFYEPIQGAIQGPEEFMQGLALGMRSFIGHTVGGAAGAFSRITGAMGSGVAALTFDKEYQRKRQEARSQRPTSVEKGLAQSGKGLVMGVVDGFSGVFTKPISGAKKEGVEGFFKGVGKGMAGLVARPTAGIIDFASGSFDAVRRSTETIVEFERQRPPRFFQNDSRVRPYVRSEAEGYGILQEIENKRFAATDAYDSHIPVDSSGHKILLLTNKRVMLLHRSEMFDTWKMDWQEPWETLQEPVVTEGGILLPGKDSRSGRGSSRPSGRSISIHDRAVRTWIVEKMTTLVKS